jgi:predicted RNA binding protein YcfA (HicA-like mRNA interferase family)
MKPNFWSQVKNITADTLIGALEKDNWIQRSGRGSRLVFVKDRRLVSIHYHTGKTFGPQLLQDLIRSTGWTEKDLKRLKLIK